VMVLMCLGVGLVLRDLQTVQFDLGEDDSDEHLDASVKHLKRSKLGWGHNQALLRACQDTMEDIKICFPEEDDLEPPPKKVPRKTQLPKPSQPKRLSTRSSSAATKLLVHSHFACTQCSSPDSDHMEQEKLVRRSTRGKKSS
jgi:hypothetical protein